MEEKYMQMIVEAMQSVKSAHHRIDKMENDIGEIKMRIEDDTSEIRKFVTSQSFGLIFSYLRLIVCATLLFTIEWRLACFSIIVIPSLCEGFITSSI